MSEDKKLDNISPVNERADGGTGGVNPDDISPTLPVAKNEIKEHDDKDDKNVAGPSGVKKDDLCAHATSPTGAKNEVKEHDVGEHAGSDKRNVAGPSGVKKNVAKYEPYLDTLEYDEDDANNGLLPIDLYIAKKEARELARELALEQGQELPRRPKRESSTGSNDAESSNKGNKDNDEQTSKRQRLD